MTDFGTERAAAMVAAARGCVGTRFRAQGRSPGLGLDCAGLVVVAAAAAGVRLPDRADYDLHGSGAERLDAVLDAALLRVDAAMAGDVLAFAPSPGMRHLGVWTGTALVHAHAGLRRVVEGPVDPDWVRVGVWQLPEN